MAISSGHDCKNCCQCEKDESFNHMVVSNKWLYCLRLPDRFDELTGLRRIDDQRYREISIAYAGSPVLNVSQKLTGERH
jgi:hypothetical protein